MFVSKNCHCKSGHGLKKTKYFFLILSHSVSCVLKIWEKCKKEVRAMYTLNLNETRTHGRWTRGEERVKSRSCLLFRNNVEEWRSRRLEYGATASLDDAFPLSPWNRFCNPVRYVTILSSDILGSGQARFHLESRILKRATFAGQRSFAESSSFDLVIVDEEQISYIFYRNADAPVSRAVPCF